MIKLDGTHKVEIRQEDGATFVFIDGVQMKRVREVSFHQSVDEAPTVKLNIFGAPVVNADAFVEIDISSDEYKAWLDKRIDESDGDVKYALMECRGRYMRLLGGDGK
jgi:hypothetical protein